MRGSIYYQTSLLVKSIFKSGAKKLDRVNKESVAYKYVAAYQTMDSYRKIWNDLGNFIDDVYGIKDFELLTQIHINKFMHDKILNDISHQYLQKISSAIGKLEVALTKISVLYHKNKSYDFSNRLSIVNEAKKHSLTYNGYRNRAYNHPDKLISFIEDSNHRLAAAIQLASGTRAEGVCLIQKHQFKGYKDDPVTGKKVGVIQTKEKGGKIGDILLPVEFYRGIEQIIQIKNSFKISYNQYTSSIRKACFILNIKSEGTHGFRWNYAQKRVIEYQDAGYSYEESLQLVSYEMKHGRADITSHYTG